MYSRGCAKDDLMCSNNKEEVCTIYGEGENEVTVSSISIKPKSYDKRIFNF